MRLLGTSPAPSSRFPHPPPFSPYLSSCPPVFLGHFLGFPLPPDRPAADRSKVISPWFVLDGSTMVPALAPFSSWPRGLVRECCPAGRPWTSTSLPRTFNRWSSQHLALFSSAPRGCCTRIWPTVGGSPGPPLPPSSNATHVGSDGL